MISQLLLTTAEVHQIEQLLADVTRQYSSPEDPAFLHEAVVISHELPIRARQFLNTFRLSEPEDAVVCVISGFPINHQKIGLTPLGRGEKADAGRIVRFDGVEQLAGQAESGEAGALCWYRDHGDAHLTGRLQGALEERGLVRGPVTQRFDHGAKRQRLNLL